MRIETDALRCAIDKVLSQMILDSPSQHFSDYVTHKNHSDFFKSEINQWHPIAFFL